jgi:hypothetical protein
MHDEETDRQNDVSRTVAVVKTQGEKMRGSGIHRGANRLKQRVLCMFIRWV